MSVSVIICAAGKGTRAGFEKNKLLRPLPDCSGITVLEKTVQAFLRHDISEIIIAVSPCDQSVIKKLISPYPVCRTVIGGATRTQSVKKALTEVSGDIVLIHDGARPYVSSETIFDCIECVKKYGSGVCALPVTDTVALAENEEIMSVPPRSNVYAVQTPQGFFTSDMMRAYSQIGTENYTDDSAVYTKFIRQPHLFNGNRENRKLTFREDFENRVVSPARVGIGIDTHAFGKKQDYIVLAGVKVPSDSGLIAHSDGDVLVHAVMDALLSAAGLRDIGYYFPDTDEKWKNADSVKMLEEVLEKIKKQGFVPCNLSVSIQAQKPRLAKYIPAMSENIAKILNISLFAVGITAGTNEGLGYIGEGKGITVTASVLLKEIGN